MALLPLWQWVAWGLMAAQHRFTMLFIDVQRQKWSNHGLPMADELQASPSPTSRSVTYASWMSIYITSIKNMFRLTPRLQYSRSCNRSCSLSYQKCLGPVTTAGQAATIVAASCGCPALWILSNNTQDVCLFWEYWRIVSPEQRI